MTFARFKATTVEMGHPSDPQFQDRPDLFQSHYGRNGTSLRLELSLRFVCFKATTVEMGHARLRSSKARSRCFKATTVEMGLKRYKSNLKAQDGITKKKVYAG